MGTWGTGILQNDTTLDVWIEFKDLYNSGHDIKKIRKHLEKEYQPNKSKEYYSEIWTGIAYGQWMCGELEAYTMEKVKVATNEKWMTLWAEDKIKLQKRINVLSEFIKKIQTPRPVPLKRKKVVNRPSFFKKGDIISIEINNQQFAGAIVTNHSDSEIDGGNRIVFTDCIANHSLNIEEVLHSNILYLDRGGENNYYRSYFEASFSARNMVKKIKFANKVGEINNNEFLWLNIGIPIGDWNIITELYNEQLEFLLTNQSDKPINVSVQDFLKRDEKLEAILIEWDKKIFREKLNR